MPTGSVRATASAAAILSYLGLSCLFGGDGAGKPKAAPPEQPPGKWTRRYYPAEIGCGRMGCHSSAPLENEDFLCRCDEYKRWTARDKHADAFKALKNERGRAMEKILGYKVTESKWCLSCHGVPPKDNAYLDKRYKQEQEGVSCSVCHGPYRDWYTKHSEYPGHEEWRNVSRSEKEEKFGMTDLWDPVKRASLCASCHVGNLAEDKFVTHDMYAAGHPPLPGFEVGTFSDQMPPHWQELRDKKPTVRKWLEKEGKDRARTRLVLVGAAVSLSASMELLQRQAEDCQKVVREKDADPDRQVLDLAAFDCYACHHDLTSPSWRQKQGFAGKPGRVPMPAWPTALIPFVVRQGGGDPAAVKKDLAEYEKRLQAVRRGFDARPLGDPALIGPAAKALRVWADELAKRLNRKVDAEEADRLRLALPGAFKDARLDYDSARQVAWAFRTLHREHQDVTQGKEDARVDPTLKALECDLGLKFTEGRGTWIAEGQKGRLATVYRFGPDRFRQSLLDLEKTMKRQ